ncbi:conserved hypothetical protein [Mycobacterium marinum E11]|nr:conserved hypothetical protein [Mycobacterium marinum E11]
MRIGPPDSGLVYLDGDQRPLGRHEGRSGAAVAWLNTRTPQPAARVLSTWIAKWARQPTLDQHQQLKASEVDVGQHGQGQHHRQHGQAEHERRPAVPATPAHQQTHQRRTNREQTRQQQYDQAPLTYRREIITDRYGHQPQQVAGGHTAGPAQHRFGANHAQKLIMCPAKPWKHSCSASDIVG